MAQPSPSERGLAKQKVAKSVGRVAKNLHCDRFEKQLVLQKRRSVVQKQGGSDNGWLPKSRKSEGVFVKNIILLFL